MLHCKIQPYNSVWIKADSQDELGLTFMRFQEHYESVNPKFRNKIFTLGQLKRWYSEKYGSDSYHVHWTGFNLPSSILEPFKDGLFDPLTAEENNLLNLFRYRQDLFYIIGAQNNETLRHELAHALYATNIEYRKQIDRFIQQNKKKLTKTLKFIKNKGYHTDVLNDELQAYITDNDDSDIISLTCPMVISGINKIYNKFNTKRIKK